MGAALFGVDLFECIQFAGSVGQVSTAVLAAGIAVRTFRHQRQQAALNLINGTNTLANLVNTTVIQSPEARAAFGRLQDPIVGVADDAILFMYLNYVHNTFRTFKAGAVTPAVWSDTLDSCAGMTARLQRTQLERLLARGYEMEFRAQVLARHDRAMRRGKPGVGAREGSDPPHATTRPHLRDVALV